MKLINLKKIFAISCSLVSIILIVGFFYWREQAAVKITALEDYLPLEADGYLEFNWQDENLNPDIVGRRNFFLQRLLLAGDFPVESRLGRQLFESTALVFLKDGKRVWLARLLDDVEDFEHQNIKNYYLAKIDARTVIISKERIAPEIFVGGTRLSASELTNKKKYFLRGYFALNFLTDFFPSVAMLIEQTEEESLNKERTIFFSAMMDGENLKLKIFAPFTGDKFESEENSGRQNYFFDMEDTFQAWFDSWKTFGTAIFFPLTEDQERLAALLPGSWRKDFENKFLEQPFLFILRPKEKMIDWNSFQAENIFNYALVYPMTDQEEAKMGEGIFQNFWRNYLALKIPMAREKILADGTRGSELAILPEKVPVEKIIEGQEEINYFEHELTTFAYARRGNNFFWSDSRYFLMDILNSEKREFSEPVNFFLDARLVSQDLARDYGYALIRIRQAENIYYSEVDFSPR